MNLIKIITRIFRKDKIIIQKYKTRRACAVTGKVSNDNKVYKGDIFPSPEEAKELFEQLQKV